MIALLVLILLAPALLAALRALVRAHLWMVLLFLPAGLLLRRGENEDLRVFTRVTVCWGCVLAGWQVRRHRTEAAGGDPSQRRDPVP